MGFFDDLGIDVKDFQPDTVAILTYLKKISDSLAALQLKQGAGSTSAGAVEVKTKPFTDHYFIQLPDPVTVSPQKYDLPRPADAVVLYSTVDTQFEFDRDVINTTPVTSAFQTINFDLRIEKYITYRMPEAYATILQQQYPATPLTQLKGNVYAFFFYY